MLNLYKNSSKLQCSHEVAFGKLGGLSYNVTPPPTIPVSMVGTLIVFKTVFT